jgi:hypothetical protein
LPSDGGVTVADVGCAAVALLSDEGVTVADVGCVVAGAGADPELDDSGALATSDPGGAANAVEAAPIQASGTRARNWFMLPPST